MISVWRVNGLRCMHTSESLIARRSPDQEPYGTGGYASKKKNQNVIKIIKRARKRDMIRVFSLSRYEALQIALRVRESDTMVIFSKQIREP